MKNIIVITGASSGFGALAARALATAGHTVYASMRETTGRNAAQVEAVKQFAKENDVDLRAIELDVASQESADQAIKAIVEKDGRLDVIIHNAHRDVPQHRTIGSTDAHHLLIPFRTGGDGQYKALHRIDLTVRCEAA
jgi:NAD(P)-dependent dehydrogenase (short-subunit alcohol dehydrogenase family)